MNVRQESRHEVIETLRRKYLGATRAEKGALIAQAVELTGYEHQYARRLLHRGAPKKRLGSRHPGRSRVYKHTVLALHRQGLGQRAIARTLGVGRHTIRTFLRTEAVPERRARTTGSTILTPFDPYLRERWDAGCQHVPTLWAEVRARGFTGSARTVRGHVARWRVEPARRGPQPKRLLQKRTPTPALPAVRTFSVRQATWLMLREPTDLDVEEQAYLDELLRVCPPAATACRLARAFFALVRDREAAALDGWLSEAARSDLPEMSGFALGIRRDRAAVDAGLTLEWSNGQTEGFVNKLKTLKRQMFGRAGLALLRERMLDGGSGFQPTPTAAHVERDWLDGRHLLRRGRSQPSQFRCAETACGAKP